MNTKIIAKGASTQLISRQFSFTEGPAVDVHGNVFFTDQPNNKIWKYSTDGNLSLFMDNAGRCNGLCFDKQGNIVGCADEKHELWSISANKNVTILVQDYGGNKLNGPNDVWIHPKGYVYFTDPYYERPYLSAKKRAVAGEYVYLLFKDESQPVPVIKNLLKPNGIVGTSDGRYVYVGDIDGNKTCKYRVNEDGTLNEGELFVSLASDGMTIDNKENVYLTGNGVTVFNNAGKQIVHIPIPEQWTANVTFCGKKLDKLFITASEGIYIIDMQVQGVR